MLLAKMYIVVSNIALLWDPIGWIKDTINGAVSAGQEKLAEAVDFIVQSLVALIGPGLANICNSILQTGFGVYSNLLNDSLQYLTGDMNGAFGDILSTVQEASTTVIVPVAALIVTYSFMYNLIQIMVDRNNQAEIDWFVICKECFKAACCAVLVSHSFEIARAVQELGNYMAGAGASAIGNFSIAMEGDAVAATDPIGQMLLVGLIGIIAMGCGMVCAALIRFTIYTRIITLTLLIGMSPIPFATFLAGGWIGQIGQSYVKNLLAYALQAFIMVMIGGIIATVLSSFPVSGANNGLAFIEHIIVLFALTSTFMKSLSIAKTVMAAA